MSPFLLSPVFVSQGVNTQRPLFWAPLFYLCQIMEREEQVIRDKKTFKHRSIIRYSFKSRTQIRYDQFRIQERVRLTAIKTWCGFYRASSLICGNKMPTRCNRWFLLQILLLAQHVTGTTVPIIRSSRVLYKWLLPVVFGALVFKLWVWCGAPDDGHSGARNMLRKQ